METLIREAGDSLPSIVLDKENNKFEIAGQSLPENVQDFYTPVIDWIEEYMQSPNAKTEVVMKMDYFNTASSKMLFNIIEKFNELFKKGNDVKIIWFYDEDDEDMQEAGEDYADLVQVPFEFKGYVS